MHVLPADGYGWLGRGLKEVKVEFDISGKGPAAQREQT